MTNDTGQIRCPFCTGWFRGMGAPTYHVEHSLPPCDLFVRLDPLAYITRARQALEVPAATEDQN